MIFLMCYNAGIKSRRKKAKGLKWAKSMAASLAHCNGVGSRYGHFRNLVNTVTSLPSSMRVHRSGKL